MPLQDKGMAQHLMLISENGPRLLTSGHLLSPKGMHIMYVTDHKIFLVVTK